MSIEIVDLTKTFGTFTAVDHLSFNIGTGELVALLGPSGCGKTTLLRLIAGLENPDSGQVLFNGQDTTNEHVRDRHVGFVFQHYALFRHMSVFENVAFGLRVKPKKERLSDSEIKKRVMDLLQLVQLDWLADRYPSQLSGGQRQRIALARALAVEPQVLLLDEPFGALDTKVRKELRRWLRRLHDEMHITSVFVTHDQEEALEVADRVVVLNKGHIEQIGTPDEVYSSPATPFVYEFLGNVNVFHSRLHGKLAEVSPTVTESSLTGATAYVRPHDIEIERIFTEGSLEAKVVFVHPIGPLVRVELLHGIGENQETIDVELSRDKYQTLDLVVGDTVFFRLRKFRVFESALSTEVNPKTGDVDSQLINTPTKEISITEEEN